MQQTFTRLPVRVLPDKATSCYLFAGLFSIVKEQMFNADFGLGISDCEILIPQSSLRIPHSVVELIGIEPTTFWLQTRRSPN